MKTRMQNTDLRDAISRYIESHTDSLRVRINAGMLQLPAAFKECSRAKIQRTMGENPRLEKGEIDNADDTERRIEGE